ncbi:MAG: hypothetical protein DHS20C16_00160 [Phycisphaerae bacterium]|nr:MAG: hypothetical protein DHS20C16_00160 [Phycisphaerae bacterium]
MVKEKNTQFIKSPSFMYEQGHAASDDRQQRPGPMHKAARRCTKACHSAKCHGAPCTTATRAC